MSTQLNDESLYRRLVRLDAQIKMEFDLIGLRVGWLLLSNSFLFTAYVVALNNTNKDEFSISLSHFLIFWVLPGIGLVSSSLVTYAVYAAHDVIDEFKGLRDKVEYETKRLGYERLGIGVDNWRHKAGNYPAKWLPRVLIVIWVALFLYAQG